MAENFYSALGVERKADAETIKKAFRKLARELHPDKNPGNKDAEARFKAVNHAYEVLSDPQRRKLYDEFGEDGLREGFDPDRARGYQQWASRQPGGAGGGGVNLEDLFGGAAGGSGFGDMFGDIFGGRGRRPRGPQKGQDIESRLTVDFVSAVRGTTLELRSPSGAGTVTVRIPAGAAEGNRLKIAGQGAPSQSGGPPGDLFLVVHVEPHPFFRREGDDLHLDVPITVAEAYFGAKVKVPTPDGTVTLKVPEGTQSGGRLRLREKGVQRKGKPAGDLYVHFAVRIPETRNAALDGLMTELSKQPAGDPREDLRF
ncbi:MAG: DnaJ C-terminal domain-containing protein [Polyangiaceae bacterium]